jgi:hypothetical protein
MMSVSKDLGWLSRQAVEYHSYMDNAMGVVEDLDELGKLGRDFSSMDVGDEVEVVQADEEVCVAMAESQVNILGEKMECLSGKDLTRYDYIIIGKDGFVPISVKPAISATRLAHDL